MKKVEEKLNSVYEFIKSYLSSHGYPPTVRDIGNALNIKSTASVHGYIDRLISQGKLLREDNLNRAISIPRDESFFEDRATVNVPLLGAVSAGLGILATQNIDGYYPLPKDMFSGDQLYMLRVNGDSMIEVGICNNDFVVVRKQEDASNNEIVVALFDDVATIKRLLKKNDCLVLHPENSTMNDIIVPKDHSPTILGVVVGCIKKF